MHEQKEQKILPDLGPAIRDGSKSIADGIARAGETIGTKIADKISFGRDVQAATIGGLIVGFVLIVAYLLKRKPA